MEWFNSLPKANKIKISVIAIAAPAALYMGYLMYSDYRGPVTTANPSKTIQPTQPTELPELKDINTSSSITLATPAKDSNGTNYSEESIDYLFASLHTENDTKKDPPAHQPITIPTPPPALPMMQPRNQIVTTMQPPVNFGTPQLPVQQIAVNQKVDIYGIACSSGICSASTNIGLLREKSQIANEETVQAVTMSGIRTNKRNIAY